MLPPWSRSKRPFCILPPCSPTLLLHPLRLLAIASHFSFSTIIQINRKDGTPPCLSHPPVSKLSVCFSQAPGPRKLSRAALAARYFAAALSRRRCKCSMNAATHVMWTCPLIFASWYAYKSCWALMIPLSTSRASRHSASCNCSSIFMISLLHPSILSNKGISEGKSNLSLSTSDPLGEQVWLSTESLRRVGRQPASSSTE